MKRRICLFLKHGFVFQNPNLLFCKSKFVVFKYNLFFWNSKFAIFKTQICFYKTQICYKICKISKHKSWILNTSLRKTRICFSKNKCAFVDKTIEFKYDKHYNHLKPQHSTSQSLQVSALPRVITILFSSTSVTHMLRTSPRVLQVSMINDWS